MKIHVITSSGRGPTLKDRLEGARDKLRSIGRRRAAVRAAWKTLFAPRETEEHGEVEYGGAFPIDQIEQLTRDNGLYCDDTLLALLRRAIATRIEDQAADGDVTPDDVRLYQHIFRQRDRLKRVYDRSAPR